MRLYPLLARMDEDLSVDVRDPGYRISHFGDVWVFEQVGPPLLVESAFKAKMLGRTLLREDGGAGGFVREGTYDHDGTPFATVGIVNAEGTAATLVHAMVLTDDGGPVSLSDNVALYRIVCNTEFNGIKPAC
jgi:hypothetical protein